MFGVGLHFSLRDLWRVRESRFPGRSAQMALATALGYRARALLGLERERQPGPRPGHLHGQHRRAAARAHGQGAAGHARTGQVAVGWLVLEDLATVLLLLLLPAFAGAGPGSTLRRIGPDAAEGGRLRGA